MYTEISKYDVVNIETDIEENEIITIFVSESKLIRNADFSSDNKNDRDMLVKTAGKKIITRVNAAFESNICKLANKLIPGDNIPLVIIILDQFPKIKIVVRKQMHTPEDIPIPCLSEIFKKTAVECVGIREQPTLIINSRDNFNELNVNKY